VKANSLLQIAPVSALDFGVFFISQINIKDSLAQNMTCKQPEKWLIFRTLVLLRLSMHNRLFWSVFFYSKMILSFLTGNFDFSSVIICI
jgi:hypothetical protein